MRLRHLVLAVSVCSLLAITSAAAELADTQVFRIGHDYSEIGTLDPTRGAGTDSKTPIHTIFEGLARFPLGKLTYDEIEPALAESWEISESGLVWTFHLRQGVMFHKGYGEMTSEDVKFSYERHTDPDTGSVWAGNYAGIIERIETPSPYEVRFILKTPYPWFLTLVLDTDGGYIVSKAAVEDLGLDDFQFNPVGTGPFEFSNYVPMDKLVLARFDEYWRGTPILEEVVYHLLPDETARVLALKAGELDALRGSEEAQWVQSRIDEGYIVDLSRTQLQEIYINLTREPWDDIRVRRALAHAIDREAFLQYFGIVAEPAYFSGFPPHVFGSLTLEECPSVLQYEYNPAKARQLLAEAGFPDGFTDSTYISETPGRLNPWLIVQEQLRAVGINLELIVVEHSVFHEKSRGDENSLTDYACNRVPLADVFLTQFFHSDSIVGKDTAVTNFSHYGDVLDSIDEEIEAARATTDLEEQRLLYQTAQMKLLRDIPSIPCFVRGAVLVRQPYVDLGYELEATLLYGYAVTENTRILEH